MTGEVLFYLHFTLQLCSRIFFIVPHGSLQSNTEDITDLLLLQYTWHLFPKKYLRSYSQPAAPNSKRTYENNL